MGMILLIVFIAQIGEFDNGIDICEEMHILIICNIYLTKLIILRSRSGNEAKARVNNGFAFSAKSTSKYA